jgi:hypothetical protein
MTRRTRRYDDEDADHNERPARRPRRRKKGSGSFPLVILFLAILVPLVTGFGCLGYWWFAVRPKEQFERNQQRLLGRWTATLQRSEPTTAHYEFRQGGVYIFSMSKQGAGSMTGQGSWKALSATRDTIRINTKVHTSIKEFDENLTITFLSDDRFTYTSSSGTVINASRVP